MKNKGLKKLIALALISSSISTFMPRTALADMLYSWQYGDGYWQQSYGNWYYYDSNGYLQTGWVVYKGEWYFLNNSGVMQTGIVQVDGITYLFSDTGAMQTGDVYINGIGYKIDDQGRFYGDNLPQVTKAFDHTGVVMMPQNANQMVFNEYSTPSNPNTEAIDPNIKVRIEFRNDEGDTIKSINVTKGERVVLYEPKKDGYEFDGWSTMSDGYGSTYDALKSIIVDDDMILYANWKEEDDSNDNDKVFIRGIVVKGENNTNTISTKKGTLQMEATIVPEDATNTDITWKIEDGRSKATISKDGLVTAIEDGTITVAAVSKSNSKIVGRTTITITGQSVSNSGSGSGNTGNNGNGSSGNNGNGNAGNGNNGNGGSNSGNSNNHPIKNVNFIEITNQPKLDYYYNDKLDLSGLKVKVHYANNTVTEEIPYEKFEENNISVTNYTNGQNLLYSYLNTNKVIIIKCNDKTVNTQELILKTEIFPTIIESTKSFDKHVPSDVVFQYNDGNRIEADSVKVFVGDTQLDEEKVIFNKANKTITIPKEYLSLNSNGRLNLKINLISSEGKVLLTKSCGIVIKDSEVPVAPTNFVKIEKGTVDKKTKVTILNKVSDSEGAEDSNYLPNDLEYAITDKNLEVTTGAAASATWRTYTNSEQFIIAPNQYFNIRKKADINRVPSNIKSKQVTENDIAHISSLNTIKDFKFIDTNGNKYDSVIEGNTIKAILDDPLATTSKVEINKLIPEITFDTTDEEEAKKPTVIINGVTIAKDTPSTINLSASGITPVKCVVKAESGSTKIYNLVVYSVKPQETACILPRTVKETVTHQEHKINPVTGEIIEGEFVDVTENVDKTINYYELYTSSGINLYLDQAGIAKMTVRNPLTDAHKPGLDQIIKYTYLGNNNTSQNANVGLKFNNIPDGAAYVKIASNLDDLSITTQIIDLRSDKVFAEGLSYKIYVPVATRRANESTGFWEYMYAARPEKNNVEYKYYAWLDENKNVLGYSKLKIDVEEDTTTLR